MDLQINERQKLQPNYDDDAFAPTERCPRHTHIVIECSERNPLPSMYEVLE